MNRRGIIAGTFAMLGLCAQRVTRNRTFKSKSQVVFNFTNMSDGGFVFVIGRIGSDDLLAIPLTGEPGVALLAWLERNSNRWEDERK